MAPLIKLDDPDNTTSNPRIANGTPTMNDIIESRFTRRTFLEGVTATTTSLALGGCAVIGDPASTEQIDFDFEEIARGIDGTHHVPEGYTADLVIRWGDPLFEDSPAFDPTRQSEAAQLRQFGYNNDFLGLVSLPNDALGRSRALLCVNHEYTSTYLMFPNVRETYPSSMTADLCLTEMAAHGGSVVEIVETANGWTPVIGSRYNRRITAHRTPMAITGPAAGSPRLVTSADPTGREVVGTMNNCAGGITPWGTWLMAEENFNYHFIGPLPADHAETAELSALRHSDDALSVGPVF